MAGFEVRWQRDTSVGCSDVNQSTISVNTAFPNSYQISGLEPGNRYTITVTVSNAAGTAPASNSVNGTTLETGVCVCVDVKGEMAHVAFSLDLKMLCSSLRLPCKADTNPKE